MRKMAKATSSGKCKASVVTDHIERFTETGIALKSGEHLDADIIVTATGFHMNVLGDIRFAGGGNQIKILGACLVQGGTDDQTVGGNVDVMYSSEALDRLTRVAKYTTVSWIEL